MLIAFVLTMPNNNSWNGKWSGDGDCYAVVKSVNDSKKNATRYDSILDKDFSYNFGDGWRASVGVRLITPAEARKLRKNSKGFCGYEWMIQTILDHGKIRCYAKDAEGNSRWQTSGNGGWNYETIERTT